MDEQGRKDIETKIAKYRQFARQAPDYETAAKRLKPSICVIMEHFCPRAIFLIQFGIPTQKREASALLARVDEVIE